MRVNVGTADRAVRIVVGLALLSLILILDGNVRWWGLVGLQPLVTGLIGWCPLYIPLGIDTSGAARRTEIGAPRWRGRFSRAVRQPTAAAVDASTS